MLWTILNLPIYALIVSLILGTTGIAWLANRRLFRDLAWAEEEVRRRCRARPAADIAAELERCGIRGSQQSAAKDLLQGVAAVMGVAPLSLRLEEGLADLCRVYIARKPGRTLYAFADDVWTFFERQFAEEQWVRFASRLSSEPMSPDSVLEAIFNRRLGEVIRIALEAKSSSPEAE